MRDKALLVGSLVGAAALLFLGRHLLQEAVLLTWAVAFGGTTTVAVLGMLAYRFRLELEASRHELARTEAELSFARKVQGELFPRQLPSSDGLAFSAVCIPARGISGDYYDVVGLEDGRLAFAIADVSGKGISAAILMANLQALLRALTAGGDEPGAVCRKLNRHLHQVTDATRFATFFYGEWRRAEGRIRYVNAGHNPPMLIRPERTATLGAGGIPLGIFADAEFETGQIGLDPGDLLLLYSDGITEARAHRTEEEFGEQRLERVAREHRDCPPEQIQRAVLRAVRTWSAGEPEDDMTLVVVKATGPDPAGA